jgi:SPP1 gp7 family putative phage head morphogenesis protein
MCGFCDIENADQPDINLFTDAEYEAVILGIYAGTIAVNSLDYNTYKKIAEKLTQGVFQGFKKNFDLVLYNSPDYTMLRDLRENVYIFSGAKTYQQTRAVSALLSEKDMITSFTDFKNKAYSILKEYNENYLKAEYNSAIAQSQTASQWMDIESSKLDFPVLKYHTVGDGRVRPTHRDLDGISRPVDDKFWNNYMPPNGWNCRCTVLQETIEAPITSMKGFKKPHDVPDIFMFNAGKDRIIFSPKHPYFKVAQKDKSLAKRNFGLPLP